MSHLKIWRSNFEICLKFFQNLATKFFKGLDQNSTPKLKVEMQFYVDSENFTKNYETLLNSIVLNKINFVNIAN